MKKSSARLTGLQTAALAWLSFFLCVALFAFLSLGKPTVSTNSPPGLLSGELCAGELFKTPNTSSQFSESCLIEYEPTPVSMKFAYFGSLDSVEGYWYGKNAYVSIDEGTRKFEGTPRHTGNTWGPIIRLTGKKAAGENYMPTFTARLQLDPKDIHQTLRISASMDAVYPKALEGWDPEAPNGKDYEDAEQNLAVTYDAFVVTPEEMALKRDYGYWKATGRVSVLMILIGVLPSLPMLLTGLFKRLVRSYD
jgi:hypothetical protein